MAALSLEVVLSRTSHRGCVALAQAPDDVKANRDFMLDAVKKTWKALEHAGKSIKNDGEIIFEALKQDAQALKWASKDLRSDRKFMLQAIRTSHKSYPVCVLM